MKEQKKIRSWVMMLMAVLTILTLFAGCGSDYDSGDRYYASNDHNRDGHISGKEFHSAVDDFMKDHGY